MNINGLETFLTIVDTGSLVKASAQLNVSQSTVTARLKALENELGQTLLHRDRSGIELTAAGFKLQKYAEVMTNLWRQAKSETGLPEGVDNVCNIGCSVDLWPTRGRDLFRDIHERHPATALAAWPGEQAELDQWLGTGLVDIALTYESGAHDNQVVQTLEPEQLILVTSLEGSPMRFDPNYVFVEAGDDFRRRHAEAYADADTAKVSFGSAVWALEHLLSTDGSAYLPELLVQPHLDAGQLFRIDEAPVFDRSVYLVTTVTAAATWSWLADI